MSDLKDLSGKTFGELVVLGRAENTRTGHSRWRCICSCGKEKIVRGTDLMQGKTKSCGCKMRGKGNRIHGLTKTELHDKWLQMRTRCYNQKCRSYKWYGAVGITVCDEWNEDFVSFMEWSLSNGYREGLSLDRIDNSKGYSPNNCRWVEFINQANNRRNNVIISYKGERKTLAQWCRELSVPYSLIQQRIHRDGLTFEQAISKPIRRYIQREKSQK